MLTPTQITASAIAVVNLAKELKSAYVLAKEFSDYNSVTDPGWNGLTNESNPTIVDNNGLIMGTQVAPSDVSNAIGSINQFINYWSGSAVATSAWGQNLQKISVPIV